jgi:hypothetical protein
VEKALDEHLSLSHRELQKGGDPVHTNCHECGLTTFVLFENKCAWCQASLGQCYICSEQLTPDNVDFDNNSLCSYHAHVLSKDD